MFNEDIRKIRDFTQSEAESLFLKLNQLTQQTITDGIPLLETTPTGNADIKSFVNKEYVDLAVTSLGASYYMHDTDDPSGYKTCYLNPSSDAETYIEKSSLADNDYIGGWISASGEAPNKLLKGVYNWYVALEKTAGTKTLRVYWKLIERKSDNSEVVIATSSLSNIITDKENYLIPLQLDEDYILDTGSRIVGKLYADVSGSGNAPTIKVYYQGDTSSRWEIPANTEILTNIFIPYENAVKDVDLGSKNIKTTGKGIFGSSSYYAVLSDSSAGAGYFSNEYNDYVSIIDQGTGAMIKWNVSGYWGGELSGLNGAGYFYDSDSNYIYLCDGYEAIGCYASGSGVAGTFGDNSYNFCLICDNYSAGYFEDMNYNYTYLCDSTYGIYSNSAYFDTLTYSSSDPEVLTFYPISQDRAIQLITTSTPDDKWGGVSLYYDKDADELRAIKHNGEICKIEMTKIKNIKLQNKTKTKTHYKVDAFTGEVKQEQSPILPYRIKKGIKFNRKTGKFYNKDKKNIPKSEALLND